MANKWKPSRFRFRSWDKKDKIMYHVSYIDTNGNGKIMINGKKICPKDAILMQSTGLLDKYGKEIWEGDIIVQNAYPYFIDIVNDNGTKCEKLNYVGIVEWAFKGAGFHIVLQCVNKDADGTYGGNEGYLGASGKLFQIIGNIYDNPELLKKK